MTANEQHQTTLPTEITEAYNAVIASLEEGSASPWVFNNLIEATVKSTKEKILRRVRPPSSGPEGKSLPGQATPKKTGDNDPRKGRKISPAKQKRLNIAQSNKYHESAEYINNNCEKPIVECTFDNIDRVLLNKFVTRLLRESTDISDWLYSLKIRLDNE